MEDSQMTAFLSSTFSVPFVTFISEFESTQNLLLLYSLVELHKT